MQVDGYAGYNECIKSGAIIRLGCWAHARLVIDNNVAERAIRSIAIGRKNYMFCGSYEGAKRAALIYTIVETCKLQGIEPFEYMRDVIDRNSGYPMKKIYDLTPMGWAKSRNSAIILSMDVYLYYGVILCIFFIYVGLSLLQTGRPVSSVVNVP